MRRTAGEPGSGEVPPVLAGDTGDGSHPVLLAYPDGGRLLARGAETVAPFVPASAAGADGNSAEDAAAGAGTSLDVVFPLLHGPFGEDGTVQGLLELAGLPYVGAGVVGSATAMDKAMMKRAFRAEGLPVMDYLVARRSEWRRDPDRIRTEAEARLGYPMFVKPANLGSSVGVHRIDGPAAFTGLVEDAAGYDNKVLVEAAALDCHEIECAVLGNDDAQASIAGEIVPSREFYDYDAKYVDDASELIIPAPLPPETTARVRELSIAAFRAVEARGLARVDFFVERGRGAPGLRERGQHHAGFHPHQHVSEAVGGERRPPMPSSSIDSFASPSRSTATAATSAPSSDHHCGLRSGGPWFLERPPSHARDGDALSPANEACGVFLGARAGCPRSQEGLAEDPARAC